MASAWLYPEHRDITALAVQKLDPERRAVLDRLWAEVRFGHEGRLCEQAADPAQAGKPTRIDWAAWPAIAGDHSCSAQALVHTVLETEWILKVARICDDLKQRLARAKDQWQRVNALRDSDIRLQRADPEYATRAGANNSHFPLARLGVDGKAIDYALRCLGEGADLNALGVYAWYHLSALENASRLSRGGLTQEESAALSLAVLADEAFALHFLEDSYVSGHVAGTWGNAAQRKGTHDFYNGQGMEALLWGGGSIVLMGEGSMRPQDAERVAETVRTSIGQILDAASGGGIAVELRSALGDARPEPETFNSCKLVKMPARTAPPGIRPLFTEVLREVPEPGLDAGPGSLPRARAELGPFIGLAMGGNASWASGGFGTTQTTSGVVGGLETVLRLGLGLEGVLGESGDGLVFLDVGLHLDSPATMKINQSDNAAVGGAITSAIPSRWALTTRLRLPFWLIPGDLLLALPLVAPFSLDTYSRMAVAAANGGLIPWQSGIATPLGRFQFVLGREVAVTFYGYGQEEDRLIIPSSVPGATGTLIGLRSMSFDFPVLEYRPFRTFSFTQSSSLIMQFYGGLDVPGRVSVVLPEGAPAPNLKTVWHLGFRLVFDWRHYL